MKKKITRKQSHGTEKKIKKSKKLSRENKKMKKEEIETDVETEMNSESESSERTLILSKREGEKSVNTDSNKVENSFEEEYSPPILKLSKNKGNIMENLNVTLSKNIDYPRCQLGFHYHIHINKTKALTFQQFKNRKKSYLVINKFEHIVDDYENNINNVTDKFLKEKVKVINRGFYKMWEMIVLFDLVNTKNKNSVSTHLSDPSCSFLQAVMYYHNKHGSKGKYNVVNSDFKMKHDFNKDFVDGFKKEIHIDVEEKSDLITSNTDYAWSIELLQEQEIFPVVLNDLITAIKLQEKGGSYIFKMFETFTNTSYKLILLANHFYEEVYIYHPLMCRTSNSDKFIICKNFKYDEKKSKEYVKILEHIYSEVNKNKSKHIVDINSSFKCENDKILNELILYNSYTSNLQYKSINLMMSFISEQNFYGNTYQIARSEQIKANDFWIETFMSNTKESKENLKKLKNNLIVLK